MRLFVALMCIWISIFVATLCYVDAGAATLDCITDVECEIKAKDLLEKDCLIEVKSKREEKNLKLQQK